MTTYTHLRATLYGLLFCITDRLPGYLHVDHMARPQGSPWFNARRHPSSRGRSLSVRFGATEFTYYTPAAC